MNSMELTKRNTGPPASYFHLGPFTRSRCAISLEQKLNMFYLCKKKNHHFALINMPRVHHVVGWNFTMHLQQQGYIYIVHMPLTVFEMTISGIERSKCHLHPMKKCVVIFMHQISLIFFYFRLFTNRINHKPK